MGTGAKYRKDMDDAPYAPVESKVGTREFHGSEEALII